MPSLKASSGITKFTNCRLVRGESLVKQDLWVSSLTGKIVHSQAAFYDERIEPDQVVDVGGRIVSPGLIECQLNGAFGFNFSECPGTALEYAERLKALNKELVKTGVTSYVPTITSQLPRLYKKVLPHLGPSGHEQTAEDGAESLGAHVEGPFLNPTKNGIHNTNVLRIAESFADLESCYGATNLNSGGHKGAGGDGEDDELLLPVKMITAAPELGAMTRLIPELRKRDIVYSIGHSEATYEEASAAVAVGATMITHLFNAMKPPHHRNPGIFGVLGEADEASRPFFGVIADGIHLHPTTIKIAFNAHPDGLILVTDAMHLVGLPDGSYEWTNGDNVNTIVKDGFKLVLEGSDKIAGSSITLIECVNNFLALSGTSIPRALKTVTWTPAMMLSLQGVKGTLDPGADADLVILSDKVDGNTSRLQIDQVWKFGACVWSRE